MLTLNIFVGVIFTCVFIVRESDQHIQLKCDDLPIPKSYVAYHLEQGRTIHVDGKLDDKAWQEVASTETFIDIQGPNFPNPRFNTWAKMRWDDTYLYIGGYLQEMDVFANQTKHDSVVFLDNDFEVFTDPDGSTHWYKEFEINAINTTWDLELSKPYLNGGIANSSFEMSTMKTATYVEGPVNKPTVPNKFWSVEIAMPFKDLIRDTSTATAPPTAGDQWRINFSRVEWHVRIVDDHYEKIPGLPEDNWVWTSQSAINMHLPERWGILQFSSEAVNSTKFVRDPNWPVNSALIEVYNAEKKFFAIQGYFTAQLEQLELAEWVLKGQCTKQPQITVIKNYNFNSTIFPLVQRTMSVGHIRDDRLMWFT